MSKASSIRVQKSQDNSYCFRPRHFPAVYQSSESETVPKNMVTMEEDPEMDPAAGLPPPVPLPTSKAMDLDATVKALMSSVGEMKGGNVNIKVVVVSGNSNTTMHFLKISLLWFYIFLIKYFI
jgi:hypothetical protein